MTTFKTALLMVVLTVLLVLIGGLFGGESGLIIALAFATILNFSSYWFSDKIVLSMYRAREVSPGESRESSELHSIVERLAQRANMPKPRVYIVPTDVPNAFATGRNPKHAVVAVTSGLLNNLTHDEIEAVLGHELAHVKRRDTLLGTVAATIAGAITMLATMARWAAIFGGFGDDDEGGGIIGLLFMIILAPLAAVLIQAAISRSREYAADRNGAGISGAPLALADALRKMEAIAQKHPLPVNPSAAHVFIVNPLKRGSLLSLFSTHPAVRKRIERLEAMVNKA
jgi:heat shock protein HtpX